MTSTLPRGIHRRPATGGNGARPSRRAISPAARIATSLLATAGQHPAQPARGPLIELGRQVDEAAPPFGVLQATTRPSPQTWACTGLARTSPGPAATAPQVIIHSGTVDPGAALVACTRAQRARHSHRHRRVAGRRCLVQRQQRDHPAQRGQPLIRPARCARSAASAITT